MLLVANAAVSGRVTSTRKLMSPRNIDRKIETLIMTQTPIGVGISSHSFISFFRCLVACASLIAQIDIVQAMQTPKRALRWQYVATLAHFGRSGISVTTINSMISHGLVLHLNNISVIATCISLFVWIILKLVIVIRISVVAAGSCLAMSTVYSG